MAEPSIITDIYQNRARVTFSPGRHTYSIRVHGHVEKLFQPSVTGILGMKAKPQLVGWAAKQALLYVLKKLGAYESAQGAPPFTIDTREIHGWLADAQDGWKEDDTATTIGHVAHAFLHEELKFRAGLTPHRPQLPLVYNPVMMPNFTPVMVEAANFAVRAGLEWFNEHDIKPLLMERPLWMPQDGFVGTPDLIAIIDGELAIADYKTSKRIYPEYWLQLASLQAMYMNEFPGKVIKRRWAINIKKDGTGLEAQKRGLEEYAADLDAFMACWTLYRWDRENDDYKKGSPIQVLGDLDLLVARPK